MGIEIEGDVSGVKTVVSDQWPVVSETRIIRYNQLLLDTDHWALTTFFAFGTQLKRNLHWGGHNEKRFEHSHQL
jgi:hypothetical protein